MKYEQSEYNNSNNFSWKGFLGKAFLVVTFVFLLMWVFPIPGDIRALNKKVNGVDGNVNGIEQSVRILTDRIYAENVERMQNVARNYFTISKLPKQTGESVTLTLGDMLDKKLILTFTDKDGNACNETRSYVKITRLDKEYEIKTELSCNGVTDYVLSYMDLECNLLCNGSCTTEVVEQKVDTPVSYMLYKHSRTTEITTWSDWSEWTTEVKTADDTKSKTQYQLKKWVSVQVYEYEHTREVTGDKVCTSATIKGECHDEQVVDRQGYSKTCYTTESYPVVDYETYCVKTRVRVGTEQRRLCSGCGVTVVPIYDYINNCNNTRTVERTETRQVSYDCSVSTTYKTVTVCAQDTITENCVDGETRNETIWTSNEVETGYTATGNKRIVGDNGYFEIETTWVDEIKEGYEVAETRTVYSYRYKTVSRNTDYKWSTSMSLGDGWIYTGESQTVTK